MTASVLIFLAAIAARTAVVFFLLVAGIRLTGKRQFGEINLHDLLFVLIVSNAVQNAMTKGDGRLSVALVSAGTLILFGWLFQVVIARFPSTRAALVGSPIVLVHDRQVIPSHLAQARLTEEDLLAAIRERGYGGLDEVRLAVLEADGSIGVVPVDRGPEE